MIKKFKKIKKKMKMKSKIIPQKLKIMNSYNMIKKMKLKMEKMSKFLILLEKKEKISIKIIIIKGTKIAKTEFIIIKDIIIIIITTKDNIIINILIIIIMKMIIIKKKGHTITIITIIIKKNIKSLSKINSLVINKMFFLLNYVKLAFNFFYK